MESVGGAWRPRRTVAWAAVSHCEVYCLPVGWLLLLIQISAKALSVLSKKTAILFHLH